jgi:hypothetical protein
LAAGFAGVTVVAEGGTAGDGGGVRRGFSTAAAGGMTGAGGAAVGESDGAGSIVAAGGGAGAGGGEIAERFGDAGAGAVPAVPEAAARAPALSSRC